MMTPPLHHHDMESHIICDKNGKAVFKLMDDLDSDLVIKSVNLHNELIEALKASATMTNELLRTIDQDNWYADDLVALRVKVLQTIAKAEGR